MCRGASNDNTLATKQTDTDRHRQKHTDTDRNTQTHTDTDRHPMKTSSAPFTALTWPR